MSSDALIGLVSGPAGALVCLAVALYVVIRGQMVVPGYVDKQNRAQIQTLNEEALKQDEIIAAQSAQLTDQRVHAAKLEQQVTYLSEQVERLTREIESLRAQFRDSL